MRRLKLMTALIVTGVLCAGGLAYASAQFTQTSVIKLTATKAGKPTGLKASLLSADPGAPLGKPQGLKTLTITLPKNTKFNFKSTALKQCKKSEREIAALLPCPSKSKIGSGTAVANGAPAPGLSTIPENATAYAGHNEIIFLLTPATPGGGAVLVLYGKVSANKVTTAVPVINLGGVNIVITALNLSIKTIGAGKQAFITAGSCTAGKFVVKSGFVYQSGAPLSITSSSKCSK